MFEHRNKGRGGKCGAAVSARLFKVHVHLMLKVIK